MASNPYMDLPSRAFWRAGVADYMGRTPENLYSRKWPIEADSKIATAGSCFAQHIGRRLKARGLNVLDVEPAPEALQPERRMEFGYSIYSARYGNIYTVRQLLQLAQEAFGERPQSALIWEKKGRFVDALRPSIEPVGLQSNDAVAAHRARHLERVRGLFEQMEILVFTLGLTEHWTDVATGTTLPTCPGTVAGLFDPDAHAFGNFSYNDVHDDFVELRELLLRRSSIPANRQALRFLLTVSPVPLTATASPLHVMQATVYSKSVLRAAAGALAAEFDDVDYFPSYEIITNPWLGRRFYDDNLRSVSEEGVDTVMQTFQAAHFGPASAVREEARPQAAPPPRSSAPVVASEADDQMALVCDEELLGAFGPRAAE